MRIEIDGATYELAPWSLEDGRRWLFRLARILAPVLTSSGVVSSKSDAERNAAAAAAIGVALETIDDATFLAFADTIERYTSLVTRNERGEELINGLTSIRTVYMRGRYYELLELGRAHLQREYADFFGRLVRQLGQLGAAK